METLLNKIQSCLYILSFVAFSLRDTLIGYIDASPYDEELKVEDTLMTTITKFPSSKDTPGIVLTTHAVAVWNLVNSAFTERQNQGH